MRQIRVVIPIAFFLTMLIFAGCVKDSPKPHIYENKAIGINFTGPCGWHQASTTQLKEVLGGAGQNTGLLTFFTKQPFGSTKEFNPNISLSVEDVAAVSGARATAYSIADSIAKSLASEINGFRLLKEPSIVIVNGREGASFVYEGKEGNDFFDSRIRACVYVFMRGNLVFIIQAMDKTIDFEDTLKDFEGSLKSLRIK